MKPTKALLDQIVLEDRHLELERAIVVLVIDEQHADELLADIDLGRIVLLRARHDPDLGIAEHALEIGVEFPDFLNVHGSLQIEFSVGAVLGRDGGNRQRVFARHKASRWIMRYHISSAKELQDRV